MIDGLVSIVIPVYNCQDYIGIAINSVLKQDFQNYEIIIVDDCSTDGTARIVADLSKHDERIKYIKLDNNSGAAVARNTGLKVSEGRYVAFLDSDDLWKANKLSTQIQFMKNINVGFVFGEIDFIDEKGNLTKGRRKAPKIMTYSKLLRNTAIATSTVLLDRKVVGNFSMPILRSGQDYATWLKILRENNISAYSCGSVVSSYRQRSGSLSSKKTKNWKKVYYIQTHFEKIPAPKAFLNCVLYMFHGVLKYFF